MATLIVAELGVNHNGNPAIAHEMIDIAADIGVDAIKVQSYRAEDFLALDHDDFGFFKSCEIYPYLQELCDHTHEKGMEFGATPTSTNGVLELSGLGVDFIKNGSDYLLRKDILGAMARTRIHTVVSCGMAALWEIMQAVGGWDGGRLTLLHCTSVYPCPDEQANMKKIVGLKSHFWHDVGFSDHTIGHLAASLAVVYGAAMIEKHFTLDKTMDGPDHWWGADPAGMEYLVSEVRRAEMMLGSSNILPSEDEIGNRERWRILEGMTRRG